MRLHIFAVPRKGIIMSFKEFSATHNDPAKLKPANNVKPAPLFDQPPTPSSKTPEKRPGGNKV